jgi:DNA invertase Pin-like site-specific DNA recombinase
VENQLEPLRDFAKAMGYTVVADYIDKQSGANPNRPDFRRMLSDAMQRKFDGIIVWRLDRFSREGPMNTMAYIKQLRDRGVWLKSMTETWLDTSQTGLADGILGLMAWMAEEERRRISERTKAGIQRRKNIGQYHGGRRLGSKNKPRSKGRVASR